MNGLDGEGCPLIWLWRSRGYSTCPYRRKPYLPGMRMSRGYSTSSCTWTGISPASADPRWPSPGCIFLVDADMWALILSIVCICLGAPICFDLWALFVSDTSQCCAFFLVFTRVFSFLQMWVPVDDNSPKLVEMISCKHYIYVW